MVDDKKLCPNSFLPKSICSPLKIFTAWVALKICEHKDSVEDSENAPD